MQITPSCHPKRVNELKAEAEKGVGIYLATEATKCLIKNALDKMQAFQDKLTKGE